MQIIAVFGPTGVGKTAVALALGELLSRARRGPGGGVGRRAAGYAGLRCSAASPARPSGALEHRLLSFLPLDATFSAGRYAGSPARRSMACSRRQAADWWEAPVSICARRL